MENNQTPFYKNCPKCSKIIYLKSKHGLNRSLKTNAKCYSCAQIGHITSEKTKILLSELLKGENNPMFGKTHTEIARKKISEKNRLKIVSYEHRKNISEALKGRKFSEDHKRKLSEINKIHNGMRGKHHSLEWKKKMSISHKGSKCNFWKGGITKTNYDKRVSEMSNYEYRNWRKSVYERDHYTCQLCGDDRGGNLHAHHLFPYAQYSELRLDIDNGITLCKECHIDVHQSKTNDKLNVLMEYERKKIIGNN